MQINTILQSLIFLVFTGVTSGQAVEFMDDFESGGDNWELNGTWDTSDEEAFMGNKSLTDSPGGVYGSNIDFAATLKTGIDLSQALDAKLSFYAIYDIEGGNFDFCFVEASTDDGNTWINIATFFGQGNLSPWTAYEFPLGGFAGNHNVKIRFRMLSDPGGNYDGIYIDDLMITSFDQDNTGPLILHTGPEFYEGVAGDMTIAATLLEVSNIGLATLDYSIDGEMHPFVIGTNTAGDQWEFLIPAAEAGAQIDYSITASDDSANSNSSTSSTFSYIAGRHEFVDNGVVTFINNITPGGNSGAAVRYNLDDRKIAFALIRNYTDINRPNSPMNVHVWEVDSSGMFPGADLIPPITLEAEANLQESTIMTRVDLRDFQELWNISGDVFIGFTVSDGETWLVQTSPAIGNSSFVQTSNGWEMAGVDFHFRLVTGEAKMTNIEELIFDQSIALFPNPTSSNAQLQLALEKTSDLSIQISNQLGQVIDHMTQKNVGFGKIELNTARLSSGIYYISISNGELVSTKKLIKQ